jgi:hypothetical protein
LRRVERLPFTAELVNRRAHECNGSKHIAHHERELQAQHAIAEPAEVSVPARVSNAAPRMHSGAIDFNDEPNGRREQVHDVPARQHDLAPDVHAEPACRQGFGKALFRRMSEARCCRGRASSTSLRRVSKVWSAGFCMMDLASRAEPDEASRAGPVPARSEEVRDSTELARDVRALAKAGSAPDASRAAEHSPAVDPRYASGERP